VAFEGSALRINIQRDIAVDFGKVPVLPFDNTVLLDNDMRLMDVFGSLVISSDHPNHQTGGVLGEKCA
jgi:hypothetical protein